MIITMGKYEYLILGPQGSGKGTQAQALANLLRIPHISTGDIFRQLAGQQSEFGQELDKILKTGQLVPDDITNKLVANRLAESDTNSGFVLDGFPRNMKQAEFLAKIKPDVLAIYLELSDEEAVKRISGRRVCPNCQAVYHLQYNPPRVDEVCNIDGAHLLQRTDDTKEAVLVRLANFHQQTEPLLDFYHQRGKLKRIDGAPPIDVVTANLRAILGL